MHFSGSESTTTPNQPTAPAPSVPLLIQPLTLGSGSGSSHNKYQPQKLLSISEIVTQHKLHGHKIRDLLYSVLSLFTGVPVEHLQSTVDIPSSATIQRSVLTSSELRHQQLQRIVQRFRIFGWELDEGPYKRAKYLVQLVTFGGEVPQRFFVGVPEVTSTSAAVRGLNVVQIRLTFRPP